MGFNVMPVRVGPNGLISDHALPLVDLDNRLGPGPVWVTSQHVLEREWKISLAMDFLAQLVCLFHLVQPLQQFLQLFPQF